MLKKTLEIVNTDQIDGDKLIVDFSDRTTAIYSVDELAKLTPESRIHEDDVKEE